MFETERREFSRVDAFISLHTRVVSEEERHRLRSWACAKIAAPKFEQLPDLEDSPLSDSIRIINRKLDLILNLLTHRDKDFYSLKTSRVNISGSGLSFDSEELYPPDETLELKMVFSETPDVMLCVCGTVVKSERINSGECRIYVKFTVIDEEVRDRIVKYVFDKQREMIRKARRL